MDYMDLVLKRLNYKMNSKYNLYNYFGVSKGCTDLELTEAYELKISKTLFAYINGQIDRKQLEHEIVEITNLFKFLSKDRAWYDWVMGMDKKLLQDDIEEVQLENDIQDDEEDRVSITIPKRIVDGFGMELLKFTLPLVLAFFIVAAICMSDKLVFSICIFLGALCSGVSIGKYVLFRSIMKGDKND